MGKKKNVEGTEEDLEASLTFTCRNCKQKFGDFWYVAQLDCCVDCAEELEPKEETS